MKLTQQQKAQISEIKKRLPLPLDAQIMWDYYEKEFLIGIARDIIECVLQEQLHRTTLKDKARSDGSRLFGLQLYDLLQTSGEIFLYDNDKAASLFIILKDLLKDHFSSTHNGKVTFTPVSESGVSFYEMACEACNYETRVESNRQVADIGEKILMALVEKEKYRKGEHINKEDFTLFKAALSTLLQKELPALKQSSNFPQLMKELATTLAKEFFQVNTFNPFRKDKVSLNKKFFHTNDFAMKTIDILTNFIATQYVLSNEEKELLILYKKDLKLGSSGEKKWMGSKLYKMNDSFLKAPNTLFLSDEKAKIGRIIHKDLSLSQISAIAAMQPFNSLLRYLVDTEASSAIFTDGRILHLLFTDVPFNPQIPTTLTGEAEEARHIIALSHPRFSTYVSIESYSNFSPSLKTALSKHANLDKAAIYNLCICAIRSKNLEELKMFFPKLLYAENILDLIKDFRYLAIELQQEDIQSYLKEQSARAATLIQYLSGQGVTHASLPSQKEFHTYLKAILPLISISHDTLLTANEVTLPLDIMLRISSHLLGNAPIADLINTWALTRNRPTDSVTYEAFFEWLTEKAAQAPLEPKVPQHQSPTRTKSQVSPSSTLENGLAIQTFQKLYMETGSGPLKVAIDQFLLASPQALGCKNDLAEKIHILLLDNNSPKETLNLSVLHTWLKSEDYQAWLSKYHKMGMSTARAFGIDVNISLTTRECTTLSQFSSLLAHFKEQSNAQAASLTETMKEFLEGCKSGQLLTISKAANELCTIANEYHKDFPFTPSYKALARLCTLLSPDRLEQTLQYMIASGTEKTLGEGQGRKVA